MKFFFKTFCLILFFNYCFLQNKNESFSLVDQKVLNFPSFNSDNLDSLAFLITHDFSNDSEKVRAIYVWVTENIYILQCSEIHGL